MNKLASDGVESCAAPPLSLANGHAGMLYLGYALARGPRTVVTGTRGGPAPTLARVWTQGLLSALGWPSPCLRRPHRAAAGRSMVRMDTVTTGRWSLISRSGWCDGHRSMVDQDRSDWLDGTQATRKEFRRRL